MSPEVVHNGGYDGYSVVLLFFAVLIARCLNQVMFLVIAVIGSMCFVSAYSVVLLPSY